MNYIYTEMNTRILTFTGSFLIAVLACLLLTGFIVQSALALENSESHGVIDLTVEEQAWLAEHNKVKVALYPLAPYQFKSKGVFTGYQVDLLKIMLEKTGLESEFSLNPLAEVLQALKEHDADIALNFMKTKQRSRYLLFSENTFEIQMAIFAQTKRHDVDSIELLKNLRIASYKGYGYEPTLKRLLPEARIIRADDVEGMLRLVGTGKADAAIQEINTGEYILRKNYVHNVINHGEFLADGESRLKGFEYVVRNDLPQLLSILDKAYAAITPSEKQRIWEKWFSSNKPAIAKQVIHFTPQERAWLAHNYTVQVRVSNANPYMFLDDGKPVGIAVSFINEISESTGIKFHFVMNSPSFSKDLKGLIAHTGPDVISSLMPTLERQKHILFTKAYMSSPRFIFTRDDAPFVSSIEMLFDKKVAVVKGYAVLNDLARNYPDIDLQFYDDNKEALEAVSSGKAFAFIGDIMLVPHMINEYGLKNLKAVAPSGLPEHITAMGIRNDWPELQSIISKGLAAIPPEDKAAIINKWSSVKFDHGIHPKDVIAWVLIVVMAVSGIILLFILWNRSLKKQVRQRTDELTVEVKERKQAEEAVRISEERFKQVANNAQEWVWEVDADGLYTYSSTVVEKILGYRPEELVGKKHFYDLFCAEEREAHKASALRLFRQKQPFTSFENVNVHKSGKLVWLLTGGMPILDGQGELLGYRGTDTDITKNKQAMEQIRLSSEIITNIHEGVYLIQAEDGVIIFTNPAFEQMFGYEPDEMLGKHVSILNAPTDKTPEETAAEIIADLNKTGQWQGEINNIKKNGTPFWCYARVNIFEHPEHGTVWVIVHTDITERKQAEAALAESELKYRDLVDNALIGIFSNDLSGQFSFVNDAMAQMYDYDSAEQMLATSTVPLWINLEHRAHMLSLLKDHGKVSNYEAETVTKTGRHIHVLFSATLQEGSITGMVMDITDRKKMELALKESEIHLRRAQEIAVAGSWEIDLLTNDIFWSNEVYRIFELGQDVAMSYEKLLEFVLPEDRDHVNQSWQAALHGEPYDIEHRVRAGDEVKWLREKAYLEFDENGKPTSAVGVVQDITERKLAEEEVRRSESKYRILLENLPQKIFLKDTHSTYISCNENYARDLGIMPEEIVGKTDYDFSPRELADKYRDDDKRILESGQTERLEEQYELDGKRTWIAIIKTPVRDDRGALMGILGTFLDITERKLAQEKLEQYQQRLKSLAVQLTLAEEQERRRIAENLHDHVGQSLALTRMQLATVRKGLPKDDKQDAKFDEMSQSLLQAIQDTRHLIFELSSPTLNELGLAAAVGDWMDVQIANKHGIKIELFDHAQDVSLDADLRAIMFRNVRELLTNAIKHAQAKTISVWLESTADGLEITVQDDGVGFDSATFRRSNDAGGGFGLFSIQERMTDLGGKLIISSQPGAGCKAVLVLPVQQHKQEIKA